MALAALPAARRLLSAGTDPRFRAVLLALLGALLIRGALSAAWESPTGGGDWFLHGVFTVGEFETGNLTAPRDRSPLFSFALLGFENAFGLRANDYFAAQAATGFLNALILVPVFLLAERFHGPRVASMAVPLLAVLPFFVENGAMTWPKLLAAFGILLGIHLLGDGRDGAGSGVRATPGRLALAGAALAFGYLVHNYAVIYVLCAFLFLAWRVRSGAMTARRALVVPVAAFLAIVPLLAWSFASHGAFMTSRFFYYPFAVGGWEQAVYGEPSELLAAFGQTPLAEILGNRFFNLAATLFPIVILHDTRLYFYDSYPGVLTLALYALVALHLGRLLVRRKRPTSAFLFFILLPTLLLDLLYGWKSGGLVRQGLHPSVALLVGCALAEMMSLSTPLLRKRLLATIYGVVAIEGALFAAIMASFTPVREWPSNFEVLAEGLVRLGLPPVATAHVAGGVAAVAILGASGLVAVALSARRARNGAGKTPLA